MSRLFPPQIFKALLLGLFCCLGASATEEKKAPKKAAPLFALKEVHPQSKQLSPLVEAGTQAAPEAFKLFHLPIFDDEMKKIKHQPILLKTENIVTQDSVQTVLDRDFLVNGFDDEAEVKRIVKVLNAK